jgi:hypothetical protein
MATGAILIATVSAVATVNGKQNWIIRGRTTAREGHPILAGREHMFRPLVVDFEVLEDDDTGEQAPGPDDEQDDGGDQGDDGTTPDPAPDQSEVGQQPDETAQPDEPAKPAKPAAVSARARTQQTGSRSKSA